MAILTIHIDDDLLKRTQQVAEARHASVDDIVADALQEVSRTWVRQNAYGKTYEERRRRLEKFFEKHAGIDTGSPFTRDEMNKR